MQKIQARYYTNGRLRPVRLIVMHSMEAPEKPTTAENVARWFATSSPKTSAHVNVDNNSAVRSVEGFGMQVGDGEVERFPVWVPGVDHDEGLIVIAARGDARHEVGGSAQGEWLGHLEHHGVGDRSGPHSLIGAAAVRAVGIPVHVLHLNRDARGQLNLSDDSNGGIGEQ
ncbi:hypothetical protein ACIBKY_04625 [Nonomuraea sp. NPDC050394]|uniref:hypothetical protein n=1 Tax=Nonomuraea sp. NPDC050394 TaxID=3364363 RepID=UPI0037B7F176